MSAKAYQAGDLDRQIILQQPAEIHDESGLRLTVWDDEPLPTPCKRLSEPGNEQGTEKETDKRSGIATQTDQFIIRYRPDIKPTWRLLYEGQQYLITASVEGPGRRQWTRITAKQNDLINTTP